MKQIPTHNIFFKIQFSLQLISNNKSINLLFILYYITLYIYITFARAQ